MIREYIFDNKFQITYINKALDIVNYVNIISVDDNQIILKYEGGKLVVNGTNIIISKLLVNEILIKGNIISIEFR